MGIILGINKGLLYARNFVLVCNIYQLGIQQEWSSLFHEGITYILTRLDHALTYKGPCFIIANIALALRSVSFGEFNC